MKSLVIMMMTALTLISSSIKSQSLNWEKINTGHGQVVNGSLNYDYAFGAGAAYGYYFNAGPFPVMLHVECTIPSGKKILDDLKTRIGVQVRWLKLGNVQFSTRLDGVFRTNSNDFVRLINFGSDFSGILGYYKNNWFAGAEVGFDKAIVTHFAHSQSYRDQFAGVVDGWYAPPTGGNFSYGLQGGYSLRQSDFTFRIGKIITQDFKTSPMIPFYTQLGYNYRF